MPTYRVATGFFVFRKCPNADQFPAGVYQMGKIKDSSLENGEQLKLSTAPESSAQIHGKILIVNKIFVFFRIEPESLRARAARVLSSAQARHSKMTFR